MIICPWCGTTYPAFQSNCQRCGGPLTAADQAAAPAQGQRKESAPDGRALDEGAPQPPPPAPRPISGNYAWRLVFGEGWVIGALIFAFIGAIFFVVGAMLTVFIITAFIGIPFALLGLVFMGGGAGVTVWRYRAARQTVEVMRIGQAVAGQIARVEENLSVLVNGRHPWTITYRFQAMGRDFEGHVTTLHTPGPALHAGRMAYILYLPAEPQHNALYPHP